MLTPLDFLNLVLPSEGFKCWTAINNGKARNGFSKDNAEIIRVTEGLSQNGVDAYFACSTFVDPSKGRVQTNVQFAKSFRLDIDAGESKPYADVDEALNAVQRYIEMVSIPSPLIVGSGGGLHCYWVMEEALSGEDWTRHAKAFKRSTVANGLQADPAITADSSRILRVPGTLNFKIKENPRAVRILQLADPMPLSEFVGKINPEGLSSGTDRTLVKSLLGGLNSRDFPPSDGLLVAKNCKQLAHFREVKGNTTEPIWYANLGVLAYCTNGDRLSQEWSSGHPDYSYEATDRKLQQARRASGPSTCGRFKELNPDGCQGCPHNVTSPIRLGYSEAIVTPPFIEEEKKPDLPEGFYWGPNMQIMTRVKNMGEDGSTEKFTEVEVCRSPFYIASAREHETNGSSGKKTLKITHRTARSPWKSFTVPESTLEGNNWKVALAEYGVRGNYGQEKHFRRLVTAMIQRRDDMYNRDVCYSSFGWKHDMTAFLVGRYLYKKDGVYEASGTEELETMSDNLRPSPKGSFTEWRRLASHCFAPECEPQGLAILGSMGSPLVKAIFPANEGGCVMSLVSHGSGQGKSTALTAAESVWGQPLCLSITKTSSQVAKFKFAALTGDLPMFIDEYGDNDIKITHDFLCQFTGGLDKDRLSHEGARTKVPLTWKKFLIATTNEPLVDMLEQANAKPQANRLFELSVQIPKRYATSMTGKIETELQKNAGFAGPAFIRHLMANYDLEKIKQQANALVNHFAKITHATDNNTRYRCRALAIIAIVAKIVTTPGPDGEAMFDFTISRLIDHGVQQIKRSMEENRADSSPETKLMQFVRKNMMDFLIVNKPFSPNSPDCIVDWFPRGELKGRYEKIDGMLYVPNELMRKYAASIRMSYHELSKPLVQEGIVRNRNRQTLLTAGTNRPGLRESCWAIDLNHEKLAWVKEEIETLKEEHLLKKEEK